jgi:hypothetical protein
MEHSPRIPNCSWRYLRARLALLAALVILVTVLAGLMHGQVKPPVNSPVKPPVKPPATSASKCVTDCQADCSDLDIKQQGACKSACTNKCEGKTNSNPYYDPGCFDRTLVGNGKDPIRCTIVQPPVNQHETPFPKLVFAPGDKVQVNADGCVQTGGVGSTWKRYVNPYGPDHMYHGMIRIPSGTKDSALVEIKDVMSKTMTVTGANVDPSQLFLSLGYEDDNYSDNGYNDHDDGTLDQCKTTNASYGGPAAVTILIFRGITVTPPQTRFNFDVVSTLDDPNGLPYNPQWSWQTQHPGSTPDAFQLCHNFSRRDTTAGVPDEFMSPDVSDCTDQADSSTVDQPGGFNWLVCSNWTIPLFGTHFPGHLNWFPVTFEGNSEWGDRGFDDDITFTFPPGQNTLPTLYDRKYLHVEFDSDETIENFTQGEWKDLHDAIDNALIAKGALEQCGTKIPCSDTQKATYQAIVDHASTLFNGHTILTGMFGIDGEHDLKAELHPLYAMSTLRDDFENSPDDEVWLIFVRNQGDEGYCSSSVWDAGFEDYTVKLPWRDGMTAVNVNWDKTHFEGTDGTSGPFVSAMAPTPKDLGGVAVTFHLGPPVHSSYIFDPGASVPFLYGTLHLAWSSTQGAKLMATAPVKPGGVAPAQITSKAASSPVRSAPATTNAGTSVATSTGASATNVGASTTEDEDADELIGTAITQLSPDQQTSVMKARVLSGAKPVVLHPLPQTGSVKIVTQWPAVPRAGNLHAIKGASAVQKQGRDDAQMKALCVAANNTPGGLPADVCNPASATIPAGGPPKPKPQP